MSEMVEIVKGALELELARQKMGASAGAVLIAGVIPPLDMGSMARAAIEAMREPTEAQIDAVDVACHNHWPNARKMAVAMQYALIDAALTGGKGE